MAVHSSAQRDRISSLRTPEGRSDLTRRASLPTSLATGRTARKGSPAPSVRGNRAFLFFLYLAFAIGASIFLAMVYIVLMG